MGGTSLIFFPPNIKINAQTYQELVLEGCMKPGYASILKKAVSVYLSKEFHTST